MKRFRFGLPQNGNGPCADCEERYVGCHAECERYKAWKEDREKQREAKHAATASYREAYGRKKVAVGKYIRQHQRDQWR